MFNLRRVGILTWVLIQYFIRRILHTGPLRKPGVRIILMLALISFIVGAAAIAMQFMLPIGSDLQIWQYIYDISSVSVTITVISIFLGMRLLIDGSRDLFLFTYQLPVSHKERRTAIFCFEAACVIAVTLVLLAAMSTATLFILGVSGLALAMTPIITAILVYFTCAIVYNLGDILLGWLGFKRTRSMLLLLTLFTIILWINSQTMSFIIGISPPGDDRSFIGFNLIAWNLNSCGVFCFVVSSVVLIAIFGFLALLTAPNSHPVIQRFVNTPQPKSIRGPWKVHLAYAMRNQQLWLAISLMIAVFYYLGFSRDIHPLWSCLVLCFPAMYQYGNTRCLRVLHPEGGAARIWFLMISAQFLTVGGIFALGSIVLMAWQPVLIMTSFEPLTGLLSAVTCSVLIGTAFPSEKDNPISTLFGCLVLGICLAFLGVTAGLLRFPVDTEILLAAIAVLAAILTVWFIDTNEKRERHEVSETTIG